MKRPTSDWIAIILSSGLSVAIVALVIGVVATAIKNGNTASSLSENETAVLTTAFSGIVGVLGAWVGYRAGERNGTLVEPDPPGEQATERKEWPRSGDFGA